MAALRRILHVDDDEDIRTITRLSIELGGDLEIHQCASGGEAIARVAAIRPDLFLLDYMMPGMNGEETLDGLRGVPGFEATPVVFMTARVLDGEISARVAERALAVVTKPFEPLELCDRLLAAWERRPA